MSNKDIKKGIAIQAKVDAAKVEKLTKGLHENKAVLESLELGQQEIRDAMGIVLDDMSTGEAKLLFNLDISKTASELDTTEKRVLCACIYTLLISYGQNTEEQTLFYTNLEKYLGVSERKNDLDFMCLNNIDSHIDRMVILKAICSFLFLNTHSFAFLKEQETFSWLFTFASIKDIEDICYSINSEYVSLGTSGIFGNYDVQMVLTNQSKEQDLICDTENIEEVNDTNTEDYSNISAIINDFVSNEAAFGKGVAFSERELKKELSKGFSDVAFDSLVAVSKIDRGYMIFTTYALYLKTGSLLKNEYICLPYKDVVASQITTLEGRQAGTRKIVVPVREKNQLNNIEIDDLKLEEEQLRAFLIAVSNADCQFPKTDREKKNFSLPKETQKQLLSIYIYSLRQHNKPLIDIYLLAKDLKLENEWNDFADIIINEETLGR